MASSNGFGTVPTSLKFEHNPFEQSFAPKSQSGDQKETPGDPPKPAQSGEPTPHRPETHTLPGIQVLASPGPLVAGGPMPGWPTQLRMNSILAQPSEPYGPGQALPSPLLQNQQRPTTVTADSAVPVPATSPATQRRDVSSENLAASSLYMMSNGPGIQAMPPAMGHNLPLRQNSAEGGSQNGSEASPEAQSSRKRSLETDDSSLTPEEKRRQFLERNRIAAVKCRQRKKQYMDDLKSKVNYLMTVNEELNMETISLRTQLDTLKGYIVSHNDVRSLPGPVLSIIEAMQRPQHQVYNPIQMVPIPSGPGVSVGPGGPGMPTTMSAPATAMPSPSIDIQRGHTKPAGLAAPSDASLHR